MIVTVHLICGRGCRMGDAFLYNDYTTALKARFGGMLPQENFEEIVSFGAVLFISGSDFDLNKF